MKRLFRNLDSDSPLTEEEQAILDQAVEDAHQEIPTNSATLLVDEATSRFSSAIWYENIQKDCHFGRCRWYW